MARFFVGQLVRVIHVDKESVRHLVGMEGVVNEIDSIDMMGNIGKVCVTIDGDPDWCFRTDELEPITDTYETTTWESMRHLWMPEHMREEV